MKLLCDVNIWLALVVEDHPQHVAAKAWFDGLEPTDVPVFCRATQQGFLRLISDRGIFKKSSLTNAQAVSTYRRLTQDPRIGWMDEPEGIEAKWLSLCSAGTSSPKIWMDAYLAAFSMVSGARLVTFDRAFRTCRGLDWFDPSRG
jgi:toxin-antitoxin system PIN domain toxin